MKKILIIAYYYPPKGGSGVQRTTKFAKYLSKQGYDVRILTVKTSSQGIADYSLLKDVHERIRVYRTDIDESNLLNNIVSKNNKIVTDGSLNGVKSESFWSIIKATAYKVIRKAFRNLFLNLYLLANIPDDKKGWIKYAIDEADKIILNEKIDVIYTTSAPYSSHVIGYKLKKKYGLKWIADFRDAWVSNPMANYNFILRFFYKKIENKIVSNSDKIISVSEPIIKDFQKRYKDESNKFQVITNGYDEEDFKDMVIKKDKPNDRFRILYNGTLYGNENIKCFLQALDNLICSDKINRKNIILKFNGRIGYNQIQIINQYLSKYPEIIIIEPFKEHEQSIKEFENADALLLILSEGRGTEGVYSGKLFEYIRTGKTILGVIPYGVARDLIIKTRTGLIASPSSVEENENILFKAYNNYYNSVNELEPNWQEIQKYSREELTKKLAQIIEEITC